MKRNLELMREILLFVEGIDNTSRLELLEIDGYTSDETDHNLGILIGRGLIRSNRIYKSSSGTSICGDAITDSGHDFLDAARSDEVWRKAMKKIAGTTGEVTLDVLKAVLVDQAKKLLGVPD